MILISLCGKREKLYILLYTPTTTPEYEVYRYRREEFRCAGAGVLEKRVRKYVSKLGSCKFFVFESKRWVSSNQSSKKLFDNFLSLLLIGFV